MKTPHNYIHYVEGDATHPKGLGKKIIAHVCNDCGKWGSGFVVSLSKRSIEPSKQYFSWYKSRHNFNLGQVQFVYLNDELSVANMIAQHGIYVDSSSPPPIRYDALEEALETVFRRAKETHATIHSPRLGAGRAGGDWKIIEKILKKLTNKYQIDMFIYIIK